MYRVLYVSDRHKRYADFSTIRNYRTAMHKVDQDLLQFVKDQHITHIINGGDLFDCGYRNVASLYDDVNYEQKLADAVNGQYYMCIGNHFFHERDSNPEIYLTQPGGRYVPKQPLLSLKEPVIKTPDFVRIGCAQFSLHHFDKTNKRYLAVREPDVKFHVGIFHDESAVPQSVLSKYRMVSNVTSNYLQDIYADLDYAVVGHLHNPVGQVIVRTAGRQVPLLIPGALTITDSAISSRHTEVELPVFEITDTTWKLELHKFSVHADEMQFTKTSEVDVPVVATLPGESSSFYQGTPDFSKNIAIPYMGVEGFLTEKGYDDKGLRLFQLAASGDLSLPAIGKTLLGGGENADNSGNNHSA